MGTLSGIFSTARQAVLNDQAAINATSENIANQNTAGYTRRVVTWNENDTVQIGQYAAGQGATAAVSSQRDRVLDRSVEQATDAAAFSSTRSAALNNLQSLFALDSSGNDGSGIGAAISSFFTSVRAAAADPASSSAQSGVVSAAQTVADSFQRTSAQISSQAAALNQQVTSGVATVNSLLTGIASLNQQIGTAGSDDTSSLEDQRTSLLTQLSQQIDVQQSTAPDGTVTVSTGNGALLVGGGNAYPLSVSLLGSVAQVHASNASGGTLINSSLSGGSIGGALQVLQTDIPQLQSQLDTLAYSFATSVNAQNSAGFNSSGTAGGAIFQVGSGSAGAASSIAVPSGALLAGAAAGEGSAGNGNANALLALSSTSSTAGQSFAGFFSALLSKLGTTASSAKSDSTADAATLQQLSTQRDQLSGVSLDQEAANLTQYQRSYQAAAKLLSILNDLMAAAINLGTDTPVQ